MLIGSMLIFGTIGIFRRYIPLSSSMLAFARGILGGLVLLFFVKLKGASIRHSIGVKKFFLLALSGALMGVNWILLFEAYNNTTVATATLCYYMEPTIVILLAPFIFKEKLTPKKLVCALVSIAGMCLVSGIFEAGGVHASDLKGVFFGLGAAVLYSSVVIMNKLMQIDDAYEKTIIQLFSAAVVLIPYLIFTEDFSSFDLKPFAIAMILVVGIVHTGIAYALYFGSIRGLKAQSIAVLSYIDPVSALILSSLILGERMTVQGIVGAVLIIGAAFICEFNFKQKSGS